MSTNNSSRPRLNRRRLQFRLRTLFIVTTLVAVVMGTIAQPVMRYYREQPVIRAVEALGGRITYVYEPAWGHSLVSLVLGSRFYMRAQEINLAGTTAADADLEALTRLGLLPRLCLAQTKVTDQGLEHLARMVRLEELDLGGLKVTDAGLRHLEGLENLQSLGLADTRVTDGGLSSLEKLQSLREIDLVGTSVTYDAIAVLQRSLPNADHLVEHRAAAEILRAGGRFDASDDPPKTATRVYFTRAFRDEGLAHLAHLPDLCYLWLSQWQVTDATLAQLGDLRQLRELNLWGTQVTNAGVEQLTHLANLETLVLRQTRIDDEGLKHLATLRKLKYLDLGMTAITGLGLAELRKLPGLEVLGFSGVEPIYDMDLVYLRDLSELRELNLSHARLAGPGLEHLAGLGRLVRLILPQDCAKSDAVKRLGESLPKVQIEFYSAKESGTNEVGQPSRDDPSGARQGAFWHGDYDRLIEVSSRAAALPTPAWEDLLRLGHAHRLAGN